MSKNRFMPEQVIAKLRVADLELAQGRSIGHVYQKLDVAVPDSPS